MSSLWGKITSCHGCGLHFDSNHSDDVADIEPSIRGFLCAVCTSCLQDFVLPTASPRGPAEGERLEFCTMSMTRNRKVKDRKAAIRALTASGLHAEFSASIGTRTQSWIARSTSVSMPARCRS